MSGSTRAKKIIEMGSGTNRRELFNLSQAKAYMQTLLVGSGCKRLIEQGKTTSLRGLYYMLKHTIEGTKEETFDEQSESRHDHRRRRSACSKRCAKSCTSMPRNAATWSGRSRSSIAATRSTARGWAAAATAFRRSSSRNVIQFKNCKAKFILHVEKDTVWQRFNEDKFWQKHNCILTHGAGQPPRGVRRLLHRLHNELKLPIYCLLDNDPWGYYIYSVLKQGSINLAYESKRMAIPDARYLGLRSSDYERCELSLERADQAQRAGHQAGQPDRAAIPGSSTKKPGKKKST